MEKPLKPERTAVLPKLTCSPQLLPQPVIVKVPVPESVPLRVKPPMQEAESVQSTVGLLPKGKEQALPTVAPPLLLSIVTRLKVMLLQERVAVVDPLKATVPPLALKTGEPETVKLALTVAMPAVEVNEPPVKEKEDVLIPS